jgi:hypothetical protein
MLGIKRQGPEADSLRTFFCYGSERRACLASVIGGAAVAGGGHQRSCVSDDSWATPAKCHPAIG